MGPDLIETHRYIKTAIQEHLYTVSYTQLTSREASKFQADFRQTIKTWIKENKYFLTKKELKFVRHYLCTNIRSFRLFYLLIKIHKNPWKTQPIISYVGTLLYAIAVWVKHMIQPIAQQQPSFIKNSTDLKSNILKVRVVNRMLIFTIYAIAIYTNIYTYVALCIIGEYLQCNISS